MIMEAKQYGKGQIKANAIELIKRCSRGVDGCDGCPLSSYYGCQEMLFTAIIEKIQEDNSTIKRQREKLEELTAEIYKFNRMCYAINIIKRMGKDEQD